MNQIQSSMLSYVRSFIGLKGFAPSIREIQVAIGLSSTALVTHHLDQLQHEGLIKREPATARSLTVTDKGKAV